MHIKFQLFSLILLPSGCRLILHGVFTLWFLLFQYWVRNEFFHPFLRRNFDCIAFLIEYFFHFDLPFPQYFTIHLFSNQFWLLEGILWSAFHLITSPLFPSNNFPTFNTNILQPKSKWGENSNLTITAPISNEKYNFTSHRSSAKDRKHTLKIVFLYGSTIKMSFLQFLSIQCMVREKRNQILIIMAIKQYKKKNIKIAFYLGSVFDSTTFMAQ